MQFGPSYNQGTEKYIRNLASELKKLGHRSVVFSGNPSKHQPSDNKYHIETKGWETVYTPFTSSSLDTWIKTNKPDIIHLVHPGHIGIYPFKLSQIHGVPLIITITDFWWSCPKFTRILPDGSLCQGNKRAYECISCVAKSSQNEKINQLSKLPFMKHIVELLFIAKLIYTKQFNNWKIRKQLIEQCLDSAFKVICLSQTSYKYFKKNYSNSKFCYLPTGLSNIWFKKSAPKSSVKSDNFTIGFVGALVEHKGLHILLKAMRGISEVRLITAGEFSDANYEKQVKNLVKTNKIDTTFLGFLNESELLNFYDSIDLLVVPSLSPENQPQVLLEALARKVPILTSDSEGCAELVDPKYTYPKHNSEALKAKILTTMNCNDYEFIHNPISIAESTKKTLGYYEEALFNKGS